MYSVEEFLEQADQASDVDDDLERVAGQDDESGPHEDEAEEVPDNKDDSAKKVPKKVRKPSNRPKLDVERLKGPRGLTAIEKLFTKIQFKGNGHEVEDLQITMRTLHYWCHRLFPKYSFDDCLEHLERLGHKKPLITLKKKILFDLFDDDEPVLNDEDVNQETQEAINEFDLLLPQEPISTLSQQRPVTPERIELTEEQKEMMERNRLLAIERRKARLEALQQKQQALNESSQDSQFTEEQKALIERNRQIALEKRRAKNNMSITSSTVSSSQDANSTVDSVVNSQKPTEPTNFNELVDSFFPPSNDDNPEDNSQKSANDEDVEINDLIEEINQTEDTQTKPDETTTKKSQKSVEDVMDIDQTITDKTSDEIENNSQKCSEDEDKINVTENSQKSAEDEVDINDLLQDTNDIDTINDKMDVDNTHKVDSTNEEKSFDINSTKENTTENLLETE